MRRLLYLFAPILCAGGLHADVIPDNSHYVDKCVKIINANSYPDYHIMGLVRIAGAEEDEVGRPFFINPTICLEKGYKFNSFYIVAVRKEYLMNRNWDSIKWMKDKNVLMSSIWIEPEGGYTENTDPTTSIEQYYEITGFTDTSVVLKLAKEVIRSAHDQPISSKTYSTSGETITSSDHEGLNFLNALLITILTETLVLLLLCKTFYRSLKISSMRILITGILASGITLPYVWFLLPSIMWPTLTYVLVAEISVAIMEAFIMRWLLKIDFKRAMIISTVCNIFSFVTGMIISSLH